MLISCVRLLKLTTKGRYSCFDYCVDFVCAVAETNYETSFFAAAFLFFLPFFFRCCFYTFFNFVFGSCVGSENMV